MKKRPAFQFYPADWRKDSALQSCSIAARGLWIEMCCVMHECEPYGTLAINGRAMQLAQLARLIGETEGTLQPLLDELEVAGVFSRDADGVIFSRRMKRDEHIRNVRAEAGRQGGNPLLVKQKDNQGVKGEDKEGHENLHQQKPTPSSSSFSSSKKGYNPDILRLSELLADKILLNNPKHRGLSNGKYEKTVVAWADAIEKLHRLDGQSLEDIEAVILWCQSDSFWKMNILSGATLREKWDRLYPAAIEKKAPEKKETWR